MGRKYNNPPVLEAVCEFHLTQDTRWDLTVPGRFYESVKEEFPNREQRSVQEIRINQEPQGFRQEVRITERVLLFTKDRELLIQIGPRLLVVNALRPYPTWQGFKPRIERVWNELLRIVDVQGLERIGLRYINRIDLPEKEETVRLSEYVNFHLTIGPGLPQKTASFMGIAEFSYKEDRDRCRVQLTPVPDAEKNALILDIDYFLAKPRAAPVPEALQWIEEAHMQVQEIFEGCITDRLRELLGEVK